MLLAALVTVPGTSAPGHLPETGADTTFAVTRGERMMLTALEGDVTVTAWNRDLVRVREADPGRLGLALRRSGDGPELSGRSRRRSVRVDVPAWMAVEIRGRHLDVNVRGLRTSLEVRILSGDVRVVDVSGEIAVRAVDGDVVAENVSGRVVLTTVDDDVLVRGARGRLSATTTDGDVHLFDMDVERLEAGTTAGDVEFHGKLRDGGQYRLVTHSGDIDAVFPRDSNVEVDVSTFAGSFEAGFPVTLDGIRSGRKTSFTLGSGSAHLTLQAFDGDIVVREPGAGAGPSIEPTHGEGPR